MAPFIYLISLGFVHPRNTFLVSLIINLVSQHTVGHIGALCRTTPSTFILLGADSCHFLGVMRPTPENPQHVRAGDGVASLSSGPCPCSNIPFNSRAKMLESSVAVMPDGPMCRRSPYYNISAHESTAFEAPDVAQKTVESLQILDANPNIWICFAHDNSISEVCPLLNTAPEKDLNLWREQDLKNRSMWHFLNDLGRHAC